MSESYLYRLDALDRITFVDSHWLRFARENQASHLNAESLIGKSIWTLVTGSEVQNVVKSKIFTAPCFGSCENSVPN